MRKQYIQIKGNKRYSKYLLKRDNFNKYYIDKPVKGFSTSTKHQKEKTWLSAYYAYKKDNAFKRGKSFNFTEHEFTSWYLQQPKICHYCGKQLAFYRSIRSRLLRYNGTNVELIIAKNIIFSYKWVQKHSHFTVDRKYNSVGYEQYNMVLCCWICNRIKYTKSYTNELKGLLKKYILLLHRLLINDKNESNTKYAYAVRQGFDKV